MSKLYYSKGDLVVVNSFGNRVFEVVGYKYTAEDEIYYRLDSVVGERTIQAISHETMLVCEAEFSKKYILMLDKKGNAPSNVNGLPNMDYILDEISKIKSAEKVMGELTDELAEELSALKELATEISGINNTSKQA